jgi:hypothetical protein
VAGAQVAVQFARSDARRECAACRSRPSRDAAHFRRVGAQEPTGALRNLYRSDHLGALDESDARQIAALGSRACSTSAVSRSAAKLWHEL